jgi:hypothetical protein
MPGRMTRSAPQSPFELPEVKAVRPRHPPVLPERRKSEKIHAGSGFIWRISVQIEFGWRAGAMTPGHPALPTDPCVSSRARPYKFERHNDRPLLHQ